MLLPLLALILGSLQGAPPLQSHVQALSPDGKRLAYAVTDGTLRLAALPSGALLWCSAGLPAEIDDIAWNPDGSRVAFLTLDGVLGVLQAADGTPAPGFERSMISTRDYRPDAWRTVRFLAGGERLLVVGPSAQVIDATSGALLKEYPWAVTASTTSSDRKHFALGDGNGVVAVYSGASGAAEADPVWLPRSIWSLAFDADAKRLAVGAGDCKVRVFALPLAGPPLELSHCDYSWYDGDGIGSVQFAPDGKTLLSSTQGSWDVRCWNLERAYMLWEYEYGGGNPGPMPASFSKDPSIVILSTYGYVLDAQSGKVLHELKEKFAGVEYPTDGELAWTSTQGKITILEPSTAKLVCELPLAAK